MEGVKYEPRREGSIAMELMLHPEVHDLGDEWSGVTDPAARRKLQNRLNQRAYRRRRNAQKQEKVHERLMLRLQIDEDTSASCILGHPPLVAEDAGINCNPNELRVRNSASDTSMQLLHFLESRRPTKQRCVEQENATKAIRAPARNMEKLWRQQVEEARDLSIHSVDPKVPETVHQNMIRSPRTTAKSSHSQVVRVEEPLTTSISNRRLYPLSSDHLLSLIHYNVFRALVSNMRLLNLDLEQIESDEYRSPFLELDFKTSSIDVDSLPPDFRPTRIQRTVPHHARMDVFPDPVVRDNMILNPREFDDYTFIMAVLGHDTRHKSDPSQGAGMVVWAEPWNVKSWETTDGFLARWQRPLKGARKLETSTNSWRAKRGLRPLAFERQDSFSI